MSIGEIILHWMAEHDGTLGYVARISGLDAERIIAIITGGAPTDAEMDALAAAMSLEVNDLPSLPDPPCIPSALHRARRRAALGRQPGHP